MCAQGTFDVLVPPWVADLLEEAFRLARQQAGRPLTDGECMERVAKHFLGGGNGAFGEPGTLGPR